MKRGLAIKSFCWSTNTDGELVKPEQDLLPQLPSQSVSEAVLSQQDFAFSELQQVLVSTTFSSIPHANADVEAIKMVSVNKYIINDNEIFIVAKLRK